MGDTKKMTKMSVIIKGVLLYRNSFPWITFISYETLTMVKNYGMKCDLIGNILENILKTC
jgi:hypothetical protein